MSTSGTEKRKLTGNSTDNFGLSTFTVTLDSATDDQWAGTWQRANLHGEWYGNRAGKPSRRC